MSGAILEPDEAQKIATEYVCHKERVSNSDVKIVSFEPSTWNGVPVYLLRGKTDKQTVDKTTTTWEAGVLEVRTFLIWITADNGKIIGYKPSDWGNSAISDDRRDEELKRSEIDRNEAEAAYYAEKMDRDFQSDIKENKNNFDIDPNRFGLDLNRFKL